MKITDTQRIEKYSNSSELVKEKYASPALGKVLREIHNELISEKDFRIFSLMIGDLILGFYTANELKASIREEFNLDEVITETILNKIADFVPVTENKTSSSDTANTTVFENSVITPLRTLESDMKKVHGYGAIAAANQAAAQQPLRTSTQPPVTDEEESDISQNNAIIEETEPPTYKSSQSNTLERQPLAGLPSYHERER